MTERFLDQEIVGQIQDYFKDLDKPVDMLFFGSKGECSSCEETLQLAREVSEISEKIHLHEHDLEADAALAAELGVDKAPMIVLANRDGDKRVDFGLRYAGMPAGHEFGTFISDVVMVSKGESGLSSESKAFLTDLKKPLKFLVFYTPTCPHCPRAVSLAHKFAMESPLVQAEAVAATDFYSLSNEYGVHGVPHTAVLDEKGTVLATVIGGVPEEYMLGELRGKVN